MTVKHGERSARLLLAVSLAASFTPVPSAAFADEASGKAESTNVGDALPQGALAPNSEETGISSNPAVPTLGESAELQGAPSVRKTEAPPIEALDAEADSVVDFGGVRYALDGAAKTASAIALVDSSATDLAIPATVQSESKTEYRVVSIADGAFKNKKTIAKVALPESVKVIRPNAFYCCSGLVEINLENVASIGKAAFSGSYRAKMQLKNIDLTSANSVGDEAFKYNSALESIAVPSQLTSIGTGAFSDCTALVSAKVDGALAEEMFYGCSALAHVELPDTVTSIPASAFSDCSALTTFEFKPSIATIGARAFRGSGLTAVELPDTVTSVGEKAFDSCKSLAMATLHADNQLAEYLFSGCKSLSSVTIPNTVTTIPAYMFQNCSSLGEPVFPASLKTIGRNAFAGTGITSLKVPESVQSIELCAFMGCKELVSVELPDSLSATDAAFQAGSAFAGGSMFSDCPKLERINIPRGSTAVPAAFVRGCASLKSIEIPSTVTKIGSSAFKKCTSIDVVKLPSGLTEIGNNAFTGCSSLASSDLSSSVSQIGTEAFAETAISSVVIPDGVTSLGEGVFRECSNLSSVKLPSTLTSIGVSGGRRLTDTEGTFQGCANLKSIELPGSLESIESLAFAKTGLTQVSVPSSVSSIGVLAFGGCKDLKDIVFAGAPASLGDYALQDCSSLESIALPEGLTTVPRGLFQGCSALANVKLPSTVKSISSGALSGTKSLKNIVLPKGAQFTGMQQRMGLEVLDLSESGMTELSNMWFGNNEFLEKVVVPAETTSIGERTFYGCKALKTLVFCGAIPEGFDVAKLEGVNGVEAKFRVRFIVDGKTVSSQEVVPGEAAIAPQVQAPDGMTLSWSRDFSKVESGCDVIARWSADASTTPLSFEYDEDAKSAVVTGISSGFAGGALAIPSIIKKDGKEYQVASIANRAFASNAAITEVAVPDGVSKIGFGAFKGCTSLKKAVLPDSAAFSADIMQTPTSLFQGCTSLTEVRIPEGSEVISSGMFQGCTALKQVDIPASVKEIRIDAFSGCTGLTSARIPDGITMIMPRSFALCTSLTKVELPSSVEKIAEDAFSKCESLQSIKLPSGLKTIGDSSFMGCKALSSVEMPSDLATIEAGAFKGCATLEHIDLPKSLTSIGESAFEKTGLKSLSLPSTVTSVGYGAFSSCQKLASLEILGDIAKMEPGVFSGCPNLASVTFGTGATTVAGAMFKDCKSLTDVVLSETVTNVEANAFSGCEALKTVRLPKSLKKLDDGAFSNCSSLETIDVPNGVERIGANAFLECSKLKSVTLHEGTQYIGIDAFYNCMNLTELLVPASVTKVGSGAFSMCDGLKRLVFDGPAPAGLDKALNSSIVCYFTVRFFDGNDQPLGSPQIVKKGEAAKAPEYEAPAGTELVGWSPSFDQVTDSLNVKPILRSALGYDLDAATHTATVSKVGTDIKGEVTVPETIERAGETYRVTAIGPNSFKGCAGITRVHVPKTVEAIAEGAFVDMTSLADVIFAGSEPAIAKGAIPEGAALRFTVRFFDSEGAQLGEDLYVAKGQAAKAPEPPAVEGSAFLAWDHDVSAVTTSMDVTATYDKDYVYDFDVHTRTATLKHIGIGVSGAVDLPSNVKEGVWTYRVAKIASGTVSSTCAIEELTVPETVKSVDAGALSAAPNLRKVVFQGDTSVAEGALPDSAKVFYTVVFKTKGGTTIKSEVVKKGSAATAPEAPKVEGYEFVGWSAAFDAVGSYTVVTAQYKEIIPEDEEEFSFGDWNEAEKTVTLTAISRASSGTVEIPATVAKDGVTYKVTAIGPEACKNRANITSVTIPASVRSIGNWAFKGTGLTSATVPATVTAMGFGVFSGCDKLETADIAASIDSLPNSTFVSCASLKGAALSSTISTIESKAFEDCSSLEAAPYPQAKTIEFSAFSGCSALKSVTLSDEMTEIASYAFYQCESLSSVKLPPSIKLIDDRVFAECKNLETVNLSDTAIVEVGSGAFNSCSKLQSAILPDTVEKVGDYAFEDCTGLREFKGGKALKSIGSWAFARDSSLVAVDLSEGLEYIGQFAFSDCTSLEELKLPNSITETQTSILAGCVNLKKTNIPTGLTRLSGGFFQDCRSLTEITIPDSIKEIGDSVFRNCTGITSITIPDSVETIGTPAGISGRSWGAATFSGMTNLRHVKLSKNAKFNVIGADLFKGCTNLETITIPGNVTTINRNAFADSGLKKLVYEGNTADLTIRVPNDTLPANTEVVSSADNPSKPEPPKPGAEQGGNSGIGSGSGAQPGQSGLNGGVIPARVGADGERVASKAEELGSGSSETAKQAEVKKDAAPEIESATPVSEALSDETTAKDEAHEATVVEIVKKAFESPAVQLGLMVVVGVGVALGLIAGAAYRAKKFKDQLK